MEITVTKTKMEHASGTKSYQILVVEDRNSPGRDIVFGKQWGKKGAAGQTQFEIHKSRVLPHKRQTLQCQKEGRGYVVKSNREQTCTSIAELRNAIGVRMWRDMLDPLLTILPEHAAELRGAGAGTGSSARWDEDGTSLGPAERVPRHAQVEAELERTPAELIEENANWGMF
ncbi:hypothetical protein [Roseospira marina]|nr:hypothetical protein [Roseospira marina]MBB5088375.1 putative DNA-binding WGR domain protein [Roseospira marina]